MVSVLLPFHSAFGTLDASIRSISEQSFSEWELLLINNASSDESTSIAKDWSRKDPRIQVIEEPTIGIAHALNTGLQPATAVSKELEISTSERY